MASTENPARENSTGAGEEYGFNVGEGLLGTATFDAGTSGEAFGAADSTTMTVVDLLLAADAQAAGGVLYGGYKHRRDLASAVFGELLRIGDIGG